METYQHHPFADVWPMLEGEAYDNFALDIAANGLLVPILLYEGKILDGRNRYKACLEAGVALRFETITGDDEAAKRMSLSMNEHRRHMSKDERAFAAARLANVPHGGHNKESKLSNESMLFTVEAAASKMGVSVPHVADAKVIQKYTPHMEQAVKDQKISMRNAAENARQQSPLSAKIQATKAAKAAVKAKSKATTNVVPIKPPAPLPKARQLTPEQVDPEFVGSPIDFVDKYGHVQIETAEERARRRFMNWAIEVGYLGKLAREKLKTLEGEVDLNWLRSARKEDLVKMRTALETLRPMVDKAEEMLKVAEAGGIKKLQTK